MKQIALKYFTDTHLTVIAFVIFFICFLFLLLKVYVLDSKKYYQQMSELPLEDREDHHG